MSVTARLVCVLVPLALLFHVRVEALELNGVAPFTEFGNELYLAALFVESRGSDTAELFSEARERKMEIRFSSDLSRRRWSNNWMQSIVINTSRDILVSAVNELSEALSAFSGDLSPGDRVEIHYRPGQGTDIRLNGTTLSSNLEPGIFNLFLSAWIGPVPPSSGFRNALLDRTDSSDQQNRFHAIEPTTARIATVKSWVASAREPEPVSIADATGAPPPGEAPATVESTTVEGPSTDASQAIVDALSATEPETEPVATAGDEDKLDLSVSAILAQQEYATDLLRQVYREVRYPAPAVRRNQEGSVRMRAALNADGSIAALTLVEEASHSSLNREAERAIRAAAPFKPLPSSLQDNAFEIEIPIAFRLTSE